MDILMEKTKEYLDGKKVKLYCGGKIFFILIVCVSCLTLRCSCKAETNIQKYHRFISRISKKWSSNISSTYARNEGYYLIINIDKNGSPELIVDPPGLNLPASRRRLNIYTIKNGKVKYIGSINQLAQRQSLIDGKSLSCIVDVQYNTIYKGLPSDHTGSGGIERELYSIQGGELVLTCKYSNWSSFKENLKADILYHESGKTYRAYWINGINVDKETAESTYNRYFGSGIKYYKMKLIVN